MTAALEGESVVSSTPRPHFTPGKELVPIVQEAGWAPGAGLDGAENLVPTGIRSRIVQPVAQSLYRLSYLAHKRKQEDHLKIIHTVKYSPYIVSCMGMKDCDGG